MTEQGHINGRGSQEHFIAASRIHAAARAEVARYVDDVLAKAVALAVDRLIRGATAPILARLAALEDRMSRNQFRGVWKEGEFYLAGDLAAIPSAGIYCASCDTQTRPGTNGGSWVLILKGGGRDGRDGKDGAPGRDAQPVPVESPQPRTVTNGRSSPDGGIVVRRR